MSITISRHNSCSQRGLTLIELTVFIVVIGFALAGVLLAMNYANRHSADPQLRKQALAIAESLLEEVEAARFTYCNPSDPQAPYAQAAVPGNMGPGGPGSTSTPPYGCTGAANVEQLAPVTGARPYNNVYNYVAQLGTATSMTITDVTGAAPVAGPVTGSYTAKLTISKVALPGMTPDPGANATLGSSLLITVIVFYPGGSIQLDGYRTQYAPQLMP